MQDRYAGDIGDFGKFGLLCALRASGLSIGVNWYRTIPPESELARDDGKYRIPQDKFACDAALAKTLFDISRPDNPNRSVKALEDADLIDDALYFSEPVRVTDRSEWHREAMEALKCCDLIFLDPDNGLLVDSVSKHSKKSVKYALYEEVDKYVSDRKSVVIYNHRCRKNGTRTSRISRNVCEANCCILPTSRSAQLPFRAFPYATILSSVRPMCTIKKYDPHWILWITANGIA